jgi:hypothetical protein
MSGQNVSMIDIPPGIITSGTSYSIGKRWKNGNLVRWVNGILTPVGGWVNSRIFGTAGEVVRDAYSWVDSSKRPWYAVGSESKLRVASPLNEIGTIYNVTPAGLAWTAPPDTGYGAGLYGDNKYGDSAITDVDSTGQWSMDNWGSLLVAVHTQDGRLFSWDPFSPVTIAAPVTNAPLDNTLVLVTDERMCMVLGGKNNPRRVKWCSRENLTDWTPTAVNTAGGFELHSSGSIIAAIKVQGGILVLTTCDAHVIEYIGAPNYYARRRISEEVGCLSKNSTVSVTGVGFWMNEEGFWKYDGVVSPVPTSVHDYVFNQSNLTNPANVFLGWNQYANELWAFFPAAGGTTPTKYAFLSLHNESYWSIGSLSRTAWLNPVWTAKPILFNNRTEIAHEIGWTNNGISRNNTVFVETGDFEIGEGDNHMRVDRIWPDSGSLEGTPDVGNPNAYSIQFTLKSAPRAGPRVIGPLMLNNIKGYTTTRFRTRSLSMKIKQEVDSAWTMGKLRLRMSPAGKR